ncbi:hypothetical protein [Haloferax larsenii]|uniref:Uncharacterized protein n=1 Tax=Haloferax larsenii TaxID=302484 RepID=A0A1H7G044_HALLR|nr:hypothetical protein [Haloferax larsenii]SEK31511.1 hypothetical protein SAMN04488691_101172 [Haloferax larsenii]
MTQFSDRTLRCGALVTALLVIGMAFSSVPVAGKVGDSGQQANSTVQCQVSMDVASMALMTKGLLTFSPYGVIIKAIEVFQEPVGYVSVPAGVNCNTVVVA